MSESFISAHSLSYILPNGDKLFDNVSVDFNKGEKLAIVGDNGVGKTTLIRIIIGELMPSVGGICGAAKLAYVPQDVISYEGTVSDVLGVSAIINAIDKIEKGETDEELFAVVGDNWDIEQKVEDLFEKFLLELKLDDGFSPLSGGEKEKVLIIRALLSDADILLFDEPTNNLDAYSRNVFYEEINKTNKGVVIISHDRELLNKMNAIIELTPSGAKRFGGNYDFYHQAKDKERELLEEKKVLADKRLNKLKDTKQTLVEQEARKSRYGEKQIENRRYYKMAANALKGAAENSSAKKKTALDTKIEDARNEALGLKSALKEEVIKIPMPSKPFIKDKLLEIADMTFGYGDKLLFEGFNLLMAGSDKIHIKGNNGSGKTTLINLILGRLKPLKGEVKLNGKAVYLSQDLSFLDKSKSLIDNMMEFNSKITVNDAYAILANFGFRNVLAHKRVSDLSGGELLRVSLAAVLGTREQPDMLILDEPTNNLDIKSVEILESAIRQYQGGLLIVSHDETFVGNLLVERKISL